MNELLIIEVVLLIFCLCCVAFALIIHKDAKRDYKEAEATRKEANEIVNEVNDLIKRDIISTKQFSIETFQVENCVDDRELEIIGEEHASHIIKGKMIEAMTRGLIDKPNICHFEKMKDERYNKTIYRMRVKVVKFDE